MKIVERRPYRMGVRAEAAATTGERILDAAVAMFWEQHQISLDEVARHAGVTVQTVIRRFGGREGLMAAAAQRESARIRSQRATAPVGDADGAVRVLVDHYEELGDRVLAMLADEQRIPAVTAIVAEGRMVHRDWCARVFEPWLAGLAGADRRRRLAQLTAVCDVYTWKVLRRDARLSRRQTEVALVELLAALRQKPVS